jgi:hypothetical protein
MSLVTYSDVNSEWGGIILPPITEAEARVFAPKLIKKFGGKDYGHHRPWFMKKLNRSWASTTPQDTNWHKPGGRNGLPRMVHDISHWLYERMHPRFLGHSTRHAALERDMVSYVLKKGWHLPKPPKPEKPTPTKVEVRAKRLAETEASIKRWESKAKRAATALRKLRRRKAGLERAALNAGRVQGLTKSVHMPLNEGGGSPSMSGGTQPSRSDAMQ